MYHIVKKVGESHEIMMYGSLNECQAWIDKHTKVACNVFNIDDEGNTYTVEKNL